MTGVPVRFMTIVPEMTLMFRLKRLPLAQTVWDVCVHQ